MVLRRPQRRLPSRLWHRTHQEGGGGSLRAATNTFPLEQREQAVVVLSPELAAQLGVEAGPRITATADWEFETIAPDKKRRRQSLPPAWRGRR